MQPGNAVVTPTPVRRLGAAASNSTVTPVRGVTVTANDPRARQIRGTRNWQWQAAQALEAIAMELHGPRRLAARSIYLALTELASKQHTPDRCHTSLAYLGEVAGCSEDTARRYVRLFVKLGLVEIRANHHAASTYTLLAVGEEDEGVQLAPPAGDTPRGTPVVGVADPQLPEPSPRKGRGSSRATPDTAAWVAPAPPNVITRDQETEQTNNRNGGVLVAKIDQVNPQPPLDAGLLTDKQRQSMRELTGLGVRGTVALEVAANHPAATIVGWVTYARRAESLTNRAGFALKHIRAGENPPAPPPVAGYLDAEKYLTGKYAHIFNRGDQAIVGAQ